MKRKILCLLLIATMVLVGCSSSLDLMEGIKPNNEDRTIEPMDEKLNQAILNFTWNLFKESSENTGNIMVSPPSAYLALAMAANGAEGETKAEMLKALKAENITLEELNQGLNDWVNTLTSQRIAKFSITNSIWYREGFQANKDFLQTNADYYSAYIRSLDFSDKSASDTINKWVKDATNDKIDKIIDEIGEDVMMYLINAIYFKGDWEHQFSPNKTNLADFNAPQGKVQSDFMNRRGVMDYLESDGITGVILPYLDEQFAFVGLLPAEGDNPKDLIDNLSALDLLKLMKNKEEKNIELSLPKFESSYEDSLKDELSNMGMNIPFEPYNADFSKMKEDLTKDLFISQVKQKTYIRVDEKGTEAAAVTSVEMETTSLPPELPKLTFDRPFVYGIVDVTTGIPLFIGIMEDPTI